MSYKYPNIMKAAIEMAYDTGCVNRYETEEGVRDRVIHGIASKQQDKEENFSHEELEAIDKWLGERTEEEFKEITHGDYDLILVILFEKDAPDNTSCVLDAIFEHVINIDIEEL